MSGDLPAASGIYRETAADSAVGRDFRQKATYMLAELHLMSGDADSALAGYRRAVQLGMGGEPSNDAMLRMILISEHKADRMEALAMFGRGLGERARDDFAGAARSFSQVAEKNPGTTLADQALLELAHMLQEQGEHRQAAEAWGRLAERASDQQLSCRASYLQGLVLRYQLGRAAEAAEVWKKAVVKYPDFSWSDLMRRELAMLPDKK
jgi:tetratricopeptide (TPR) repeat protein